MASSADEDTTAASVQKGGAGGVRAAGAVDKRSLRKIILSTKVAEQSSPTALWVKPP
jgi:hypothetical protein